MKSTSNNFNANTARMNDEIQVLHKEIDDLRREIYFLRTHLNKIQNKFDIDEPTL
jgi:predicted  nucleic acid-binding Zn-ribbon protein